MVVTSKLRTTIFALILGASLLLVAFTSRSLFAASGPCSPPSTDYGTVTSTVNVPGSGTYRVWTRMSAPDTSNNTYLLDIDGSSCYTIGGSTVPTYASGATTFFASGTSNWISKTSAGTQIDVSLSAGNHTFKLIGNAPGVVVDRLILTQDTACVPTGTGDNCAVPPDTTAPVVGITSPARGASLTTTTAITANATDDVAVSKVEFYVDGVLKGTDTTGSSNNYTYSLDPSTLSIGSHTLTAKAYDTSNNVSTSGSVSVTVPDTDKPTISITAPTAGATVSDTIAVKATASDNVGVSSVVLRVDGATYATDTAAPYSLNLDTSGLTNASHSLVMRAYDAAGNFTDSTAVNVTVNNAVAPPPDTTPPAVSLTYPTAGLNLTGSITMSASASDASGIKQIEFYVDGALKATDTTAPYSYSLDTTALSNANHTFKVTATDNSTNQNVGTSSTITAAVSNVTYLPADINKDGHVNFLDFSSLASMYGKSGGAITNARADINGDGTVNFLDFSALASKYGL